MKELYFTPESIYRKAKSIRSKAEKYMPLNRIQFNPDKAALLIIDMQNIFLKKSYSAFIPSAPAIIPGLIQLRHKFDLINRPVLFTRHLNTKKNAGLMSRWWNGLISESHKSSEIAGKFDLSGAEVVKKSQYDAFFKTELESILNKQNVSQLVICGVITHLCCETTARSAFMRGFEVFFAIDGTATYNEVFHRGTVFNLAHGFAKPVLINGLLKQMSSSHES
jgi:bifunctional isochorismate lyase/aryl carrier protein